MEQSCKTCSFNFYGYCLGYDVELSKTAIHESRMCLRWKRLTYKKIEVKNGKAQTRKNKKEKAEEKDK